MSNARNRFDASIASDESVGYRPDIDGLRGVSVAAVILFHFGIARVAPGGFIGVDVFFVISGYLISSSIAQDIRGGRFTIVAFYGRRIRRIFPALFVLYVGCFIAALFLQFPSEAREVGREICASALFVSNILFSGPDDYFVDLTKDHILLHTWSLSIEEQFYVFFPLLLYALNRVSHAKRISAIALICVLSFAASAWVVEQNTSFAFYLIQYRIWEFLVGALLALGLFRFRPSHWIMETIGLVGLACICASIRLNAPFTVFPGPAALGACLGSAAILYSGSQCATWVSRFLSLAPLRFVGLISYSLYLWHWPIFAFAAQYRTPQGFLEKGALLALTFVIGVLSWYLVERPGRRISSKPVIILGAGAIAILTAVLAGTLLGPISTAIWRIPANVEHLMSFEDYSVQAPYRAGTCFLTPSFPELSSFRIDECLHLNPTEQNVLILGNSYAADLWPGLHAAYPNINFMEATSTGCKPILKSTGARFCRDLLDFILKSYLPTHHVDIIVLSARWGIDEVTPAIQIAGELRRYAGSVKIIGRVLEYDAPLPRVLSLALLHQENAADYAAKFRSATPALVDERFAAAAMPARVEYISTYNAMMKLGCGLVTPNGTPVQFDYGHLTMEGSACLARQIGPDIFDLPKKP